MKIITGKHNGFCFGVQSAVSAVERALKSSKPVYTLGPVIHNTAEVERLRALGTITVDTPAEVPMGATVVIRSHGVPPSVKHELVERDCHVIDATCPFVARIQQAVAQAYDQGKAIMIAGKADHPEVVGINGYCENTAVIVGSAQELENLDVQSPLFLVAQTTFVPKAYEDIQRELINKNINFEAMDSICQATVQRQQEVEELSKKCDAMIVVGGKHSSNTRELWQICRNNCNFSIIVESATDVSIENLPLNGIIGVVAGASTPQWSIREVITRMNEQDLNTVVVEELDANTPPAVQESDAPVEDAVVEQEAVTEDNAEQVSQEPAESKRELTPEESFERDLEKSLVRIRPGQVKKGTVVQIVGDDVFVNIGYKADGVIPQSELSIDPKTSAADILKVGDEVNVEIIKVNDGEGNVLLSKKAVDRRNADRQAIADLADGRFFEVTIRQAVKSGVLTEFRGARVFIPASQLADRYVENLDEFIGKKILVKAIEVDKSRRRVVASHRQVVKEQAVMARKEKYNQFEVGQKLTGVVRRITDFGAFTDIGGVDGLIHVTDLSWGRVKHPSDVVKVGDEVEVVVLSINPEAERIALGYKQLQPKPWDHAAERYLVGDIVEGTVDRIAPFGAFVELEPGLFGLVHISQVATRRIEKVEDELRVGDVITVKVMEVDPAAKRISLSRRAVLQQDRPQRVYVESESDADDMNKYEIPPVEEAKVSLADFFPDGYKEN